MGRSEASVTYDVYVQEKGKRPRRVGEATKVEATIKVEDRTFYWACADLNDRTITYTDIKPMGSG